MGETKLEPHAQDPEPGAENAPSDEQGRGTPVSWKGAIGFWWMLAIFSLAGGSARTEGNREAVAAAADAILLAALASTAYAVVLDFRTGREPDRVLGDRALLLTCIVLLMAEFQFPFKEIVLAVVLAAGAVTAVLGIALDRKRDRAWAAGILALAAFISGLASNPATTRLLDALFGPGR